MKKCYINTATSIHPDGSTIGDDGILHAVEPDYKDIITNANMRRRMSRIIKMGVACGLTCLNEDKDTQADAIITATGLGCLADTEKFLDTMIENEEQLLNPTAFIQSTFNTIGAQIALLTNNHCYNNTYVHRGLSFESALLDAMMRIWEGDENVLVGAIDEVTSSSYTIMKRLGLLNNVRIGEGAQFFLISNEKNKNTLAELITLKTFTGNFTTKEIVNTITSLLNDNNITPTDVCQLMTGKNGHEVQDKIYEEIENQLFSDVLKFTFKDTCGEYPTASSFGLWKAVHSLKDAFNDQYLLIYNHYNNMNHSLILLKK